MCSHVAVALWTVSGEEQQRIQSTNQQPDRNMNKLWMCIPNDQSLIPILCLGNSSSFVFVLNYLAIFFPLKYSLKEWVWKTVWILSVHDISVPQSQLASDKASLSQLSLIWLWLLSFENTDLPFTHEQNSVTLEGKFKTSECTECLEDSCQFPCIDAPEKQQRYYVCIPDWHTLATVTWLLFCS